MKREYQTLVLSAARCAEGLEDAPPKPDGWKAAAKWWADALEIPQLLSRITELEHRLMLYSSDKADRCSRCGNPIPFGRTLYCSAYCISQ